MTPIRMVSYNWDHFQPLACGDVTPAGVDFTLDRHTPISAFAADETIDVSESSLSHHLIRLSRGDDRFVGLPVFPMRSFRHRCFLVRRDSPLRDFADLAGKRVGTDGWPNTGNTWSRAAMRERGAAIDRVQWVVGPVEDTDDAKAAVGPAMDYPPYVSDAPPGRTLVGMLSAGDLDALMIPFPPRGFFLPDSPLVHLFRDYRAAERDYYRRVGYCPGVHVVVMRRRVFEREPSLAPRLVAAFEESKRRWRDDRRRLADTTPWILAELEETAAVFGEDWQPAGIEPNRRMMADFCAEQLAQGLVTRPLNPDTAFADYAAATR